MACENGDCINSKTLEERLKKIENTVDTKGDMFEVRITKLERRVDVSDEKLNQIYLLLGELKVTIDGIKKTIETKNERLPNLVYSIAGMVIASLISGVGVWLITK